MAPSCHRLHLRISYLFVGLFIGYLELPSRDWLIPMTCLSSHCENHGSREVSYPSGVSVLSISSWELGSLVWCWGQLWVSHVMDGMSNRGIVFFVATYINLNMKLFSQRIVYKLFSQLLVDQFSRHALIGDCTYNMQGVSAA